jgi:hypothetical protein
MLSPSSTSRTSPGTSRRGFDLHLLAVSSHPGPLGQERGKRLDGALGLRLLREGERCVREDDRHDRNREVGSTADPGQRGGDPQQHG